MRSRSGVSTSVDAAAVRESPAVRTAENLFGVRSLDTACAFGDEKFAEAAGPSQTRASSIGWNFASTPVSEAPSGSDLQAKLEIGSVDDPLEREADAVANRVMRMSKGSCFQGMGLDQGLAPSVVQRSCSCGSGSESDEDELVRRLPDDSASSVPEGLVAGSIDPRDVADSRPVEEAAGLAQETEEQAEEPATISLSAAGGEKPQSRVAQSLAHSIDGARREGGQPLPHEARRFMEPRFGQNFGAVRIHSDRTSGDLAHQISARAFTTGNHIFFAPSEFHPERSSGRHLLAHELTHVLQQSKRNASLRRQIQRSGNGSLNCPLYGSYNASKDLKTYNCAGLSNRTYDFKSLADTKAVLAKGSSKACGTPCDRVGVVKHWLWEYDVRMEDSDGKLVAPTWRDFHTVGGPTDGDPLAKDSDEFYTKNGARKVYGPGTAQSFKPVPKDRALSNDPSETPIVAGGKPVFKIRSNFDESCSCVQCPGP